MLAGRIRDEKEGCRHDPLRPRLRQYRIVREFRRALHRLEQGGDDGVRPAEVARRGKLGCLHRHQDRWQSGTVRTEHVAFDPVTDNERAGAGRQRFQRQAEHVRFGLADNERSALGSQLDRANDRSGRRYGTERHRIRRIRVGRDEAGPPLDEYRSVRDVEKAHPLVGTDHDGFRQPVAGDGDADPLEFLGQARTSDDEGTPNSLGRQPLGGCPTTGHDFVDGHLDT